MKKEIKIVFGEMGAGKNYWGERLAKCFELEFFDGDSVAPPELVERVSNFRFLPRSLLHNYIHKILAPAIVERAGQSEQGIVVAQALYRDSDRKILSSFFKARGFDVSFYWVQTPTWRNIRQLLTRNDGMRWVAYFMMSKMMFQKPTHPYWTLNENAAQLGIY